MALTAATKTDLYRFFTIAFNAAPGVTYMNQLAAASESGMTVKQIVEVFTTKAEFTASYPTFFTNSQFATKLIDTVVGSSATTAAKAEAVADIEAALAAGLSKGTVIFNVFNNLAALTGDAKWGGTATQLANKVAVAQYYTEDLLTDTTNLTTLRAVIGNVTNTTDVSTPAAIQAVLDVAVPTPAQNFTLTTGVNNFTGGSSNDNFDGSLASGNQTWQSSDALAGGAGTDTLTATIINSVTPVTMSGIEVVSITANTNPVTANLSNATGITKVNSVNSTSALTVSGISTSVDVTISDTAQAHTLTFTGVSGSADAETVNITGLATNSTLTVGNIESLTLNATTSASTLTTLTSGQATTLAATGDQNLTITDALGTSVNNVTAATKTAGALTATLGAVANATVTGGAGNDSFTISAATGNVNASGGAGNDTFVAATNLTTTDTISGGDGTDTLSSVFASVSTAGYATPTTRTISGIEALTVTDDVAGALTVVGIDTGINTLNMARDGVNTAANLTFNAGNSTLNIGTSTTTAGALATSLTVAGATSGADNITVKNNNLSTVNAFATVGITANNTETLTIDTGKYTTAVAQVTGAVAVTGSTGFTAAETLVLRGSNALTLGIVTADIIDASAMTVATGTVLTTVTGTTAQTVTGSSGNDILIADTTANVSINGGAGNDTVTGGAGNDTLLGGDGNDQITVAGGNDSVDGGAGNDTVVMAANFSVNDTVVGGEGTDVLSLGQAASATIAARASGFETLTLSAGATQDMSLFTNNSTFTRVNADTGTNSFTKVGAGVTTLGGTGTTTAITFTLNTGSGTSDALTFASADNVVHTAVTANDIEVLTLNNTAATASTNAATITTLAASSLTTLTITGQGGMIVTNAITGATNLATVTDSRSGNNALTLDLSASTVATTFTGGSASGNTTLIMGSGANVVNAGTATTVGNMTVTGGTGAESMTGGYGADSLSGGSGNDTLSGGEGNDTLQGGSGSDSISGGAGTDAFTSDSGADTIDGGAGTDTLTVSASFRDLSLDTITSVETLNMDSNATTMTVSQHAGFTTINNAAAITLADAGSLTGKTNVTTYTLANGTNTFTASTTAQNNVLTGGTGADTFNFGLNAAGDTQLFTADDTVLGGTGTDTVNFTGNLAFTVTLGDATKFTGIENVVFSNTTTNVTLNTNVATLGANESMTIDGSAATTGIMTFNGSNEDAATSTYNLIGGGAADVLTGGAGADTVDGGAGTDSITGGGGADNLTGGAGADTITGGLGIDTIALAEGTAARDTVVMTTGGAIDVDTVTGLTAGAAGTADLVQIDLSDINALIGNLLLAGNSATAAAAGAITVGALNAALDLGTVATANLLVASSATAFTTATLKTALQTGGTLALTANGGWTGANNDGFLVVYDDNTDSYLAYVTVGADVTNDGTFGTVTVTNILKLTGVSDASTLTANNFAIIA